MSGRSLAVTTGARCPLSQPAGAAIVSAPAPRRADDDEHASHDQWVARARRERERLRASPSSLLTRESLAVLEELLSADEEAWAARQRRAGEGGP